MIGSNAWMPQRIYGVDFSGAQKAYKKIWIAEAHPNTAGLKVVSCKPIQKLTDCQKELAACLRALRKFIACPHNAGCAFGLDFPFGVPRPLVENADTWKGWLRCFHRHQKSAEEFQKHGHRIFLERFGHKEIPRRTDKEAKAPFRPHNRRLYKQTFYGIRDVLSPLVRSGKARAVPMQEPDTASATLFEVCPACTLRKLPFKVEGAKKERQYRDTVLRQLEATKCLQSITDTSLREDVLRDSEGDGLDSVIAALAVFRTLQAGDTLAPRENRYWSDYDLEGYIYC